MIPPGSATVIHGLYIIRFPFGTLSKREGGLPGKGGRLVESFPGGTSICGPSESGRSPMRLVPARSTSAIQSARVGMRPSRFRAAWLFASADSLATFFTSPTMLRERTPLRAVAREQG